HDLEEEPRDEVASATRMLRGKEPALEPEISGERSHHTVDGVAFLGSTGEVDAAEKRPGLELVGSECVLGEVNEALAQEGELLGEAVREPPPARPALSLEPFGQAIIETLLQALQFGRQPSRVEPLISVRKGKAPHLCPLFFSEGTKELAEPGQEVTLGYQHVDGEASTQNFVELPHPRPYRFDVRLRLAFTLQRALVIAGREH